MYFEMSLITHLFDYMFISFLTTWKYIITFNFITNIYDTCKTGLSVNRQNIAY